jgi:hypothetical protein
MYHKLSHQIFRNARAGPPHTPFEMKVVRRKDDPAAGAADAPAAAAAKPAGITPKVLVRAAAAPKITKEEEDSQKVAKMLAKLSLSGCDGAADAAAAVGASGFAALQAEGLVGKLRAAIEGADADAREAALLAVAQLPASAGRAAEPYLLPLVPLLLEKMADKSGPARDAAALAAVAVARSLCPHAAEMVLPVLFEGTDPAKKWQSREGALQMLAALAEAAPRQVAACLPEIVPLVATLMVDPREQVKAAAIAAGTASYHLVGNRDIEHLVDDLLHCVARPEEVSEVVIKLSATTFVQAIEAPALAVMVPLLVRGLRESTAIQRKCCVITTNMSKLVNSPLDAAHFLPSLVPGELYAIEERVLAYAACTPHAASMQPHAAACTPLNPHAPTHPMRPPPQASRRSRAPPPTPSCATSPRRRWWCWSASSRRRPRCTRRPRRRRPTSRCAPWLHARAACMSSAFQLQAHATGRWAGDCTAAAAHRSLKASRICD